MCFNSILVRLKGPPEGAYKLADTSFNSILVRLKGNSEVSHQIDLEEVSIPYWFD